jgi:glycosyltransferase involved in cell wall biosynthesis
MKIAFISTASSKFEDFASANLLGTEQQIFGLAKAYARKKYEVYILCRMQRAPMVEKINDVNIVDIGSPELHDARFKSIFTKLTFSKYAKKFVEQLKPDIIHFTDAYTAFYLTDVEGCKVFTLHSPLYDWTRIRQGFVSTLLWVSKRPFNLRIQTSILKKSSMIVTLNSFQEQILKELGYKVTRIPNGIDLSEFDSIKSTEEEYILYGGRLSIEKGVHILIKAFSEVAKKLSQTPQLFIIGSGPEEANLKILASKLGLKDKIKFLPHLPRRLFLNFISRCIMLVLPSFYESFGVVLLEAMTLGKPVIASDIPGPRDIITRGLDGLRFRAGDVNQLAEYMLQLIEDKALRKRLGANAKVTSQKYDFDVIAGQYINLYNLLLDQYEKAHC